MSDALLELRNLCVEFDSPGGRVRAADGISFAISAGEVLGIVGESGSGKTVSTLAAMGLVPSNHARVWSDGVMFQGRDLAAMKERELRRLRGDAIGFVFQDPMTALNPVLKVGDQMREIRRAHYSGESRSHIDTLVESALKKVGLPDPRACMRRYAHELSGGMRQRVMIAMAVLNVPSLIIADEPTTALDVTLQAQVIEVLRTAREETGAATILISHDLGVIAELCDRVLVMYAGRIVESAEVSSLFDDPRHPYTVGLLESLPTVGGAGEALKAIPGRPPSLASLPTGCAFRPRCAQSGGRAACADERPRLRPVEEDGRAAACHFSEELATAEHREAQSEGRPG